MLRLFVAVLLGGLVAGSQYEFTIPKVTHPDLNTKDFQEIPDDNPLTLEKLAELEAELENQEAEALFSGKPLAMNIEPLHTFRTRDWPLTPKDLEEAKQTFKIRASDLDWMAFNQEADWTMIDSRMARDTYMAFAFRRAVINEDLLQSETDQVGPIFTIDFFDDYQVAFSSFCFPFHQSVSRSLLNARLLKSDTRSTIRSLSATKFTTSSSATFAQWRIQKKYRHRILKSSAWTARLISLKMRIKDFATCNSTASSCERIVKIALLYPHGETFGAANMATS